MASRPTKRDLPNAFVSGLRQMRAELFDVNLACGGPGSRSSVRSATELYQSLPGWVFGRHNHRCERDGVSGEMRDRHPVCTRRRRGPQNCPSTCGGAVFGPVDLDPHATEWHGDRRVVAQACPTLCHTVPRACLGARDLSVAGVSILRVLRFAIEDLCAAECRLSGTPSTGGAASCRSTAFSSGPIPSP
jgi:hypothetical protein